MFRFVRSPLLLFGAGGVLAIGLAALLIPGSFHTLFSPGLFMPHRHCYLDDPRMLWLQGLSDFFIGAAYMVISGTLAYLVYKARKDIPFEWIFLAFGLFIFSCGWTHLLEVWTLWYPAYWLSGTVKAVTALASVSTATGACLLAPRIFEFIQTAKLLEKRRVAELETIYSRTPVGLCFLDRGLHFVTINERLAEINGRTVEEHIGHTVREVLPELADQLEPLLRQVMETNTPATNIELQSRLPRQSDGRRYWEVNYYPVASETVLGVDAVVVDITERKRAENALAEEAARRRVLFEQSKDGIVVLDEQGKVYESNQSFAAMLGYSAEEMRQLHLWDWDAQWTREQLMQKMRQITSTSETFETRHRRKNGTFYDVEISAGGAEWGGQKLNYCICRDISQRKAAEAASQRSQAELEAIYASAPLMLCLVNEQHSVERMNRAMEEFVRETVPELPPGAWEEALNHLNALERPGSSDQGPQHQSCPVRLAVAHTFQTGEPCRQLESTLCLAHREARRHIHISVSTAIVRLENQPKVLVCLENVTDRKQLEAQFLQAQKMEAIGQLAGGVAHDFNNILAAMMLNLSLLNQTPELSGETLSSIEDLQQGAERAANLTRQLLLFSRRQTMQSRRVDLNHIVRGLMGMLRRLLGEPIEMLFEGGAEPLWVEADTGMLQQVLMNLCVNARDAMPRGGRLTLASQVVQLTAGEAAAPTERQAGRFVCLSVADTGHGMDADTLKRIFEPFFTTKEAGKGTGLGLATVYGIVKQHQGWLEVESAVGQGTTFRVYLPLQAPAEITEAPSASQPMPEGHETLLVVEDDRKVRELVSTTLRRLGYRVLDARNGKEALEVWEDHGVEISLLLTDMVMPQGMTGLELAQRLRQLRAGLKVIICSGYSADLLREAGQAPAGIRFLAKPYKSDALAKLIRECLDKA